MSNLEGISIIKETVGGVVMYRTEHPDAWPYPGHQIFNSLGSGLTRAIGFVGQAGPRKWLASVYNQPTKGKGLRFRSFRSAKAFVRRAVPR